MKNISSKLFIAAFITIISFLIISGYFSQRTAAKFKEATFVSGIDTVLVTGSEFFGVGRGGIAFTQDEYISGNAILVENKSEFMAWESNGPSIGFDTIPHEYTLSDLGFPFKIFKTPDSDTILVLKDGFVLKFLLVKYE